MTKRVTLSDVAKKAGVSRAAASAVLSGKIGKSIRVSEEKRAEILSIAKLLGYVPNTAAQYLKSGDNNHIIAVFTYENAFPFDPNSEYYPFFAGIQAEAEMEGYDILILNNWAKDKARSSRILLASGAIMIGVTRDDEHITSLVRQKFPLVFVGRRHISSGIPVRYVTFSYEPSVQRIVDLVDGCSAGPIVYITSTLSNAEPSEDKALFLHNYCKERNIPIEDVIISDSITSEAREKVLASRSVIFDRLFIADLFAPVFRENNLIIGEDVFGAILEDDWTGGHEIWTRWENRRRELGALAVEYLASLHEGMGLDDSFIDIPVIESTSTKIR